MIFDWLILWLIMFNSMIETPKIMTFLKQNYYNKLIIFDYLWWFFFLSLPIIIRIFFIKIHKGEYCNTNMCNLYLICVELKVLNKACVCLEIVSGCMCLGIVRYKRALLWLETESPTLSTLYTTLNCSCVIKLEYID